MIPSEQLTLQLAPDPAPEWVEELIRSHPELELVPSRPAEVSGGRPSVRCIYAVLTCVDTV